MKPDQLPGSRGLVHDSDLWSSIVRGIAIRNSTHELPDGITPESFCDHNTRLNVVQEFVGKVLAIDMDDRARNLLSFALMITVSQTSHSYEVPGAGGESLAVLNGIELVIEQGEFVSVIGPSGCGKSTLLRLIAGLAVPDAGDIRINGLNPLEMRRRREIGFVFQSPELFPWRTVEDNVRLPLEIFGQGDGVDETVRTHLELVGLLGFEKYRPAQLSGGMRSRVALARALVYEPNILLMDESFGSLDELTREKMQMELLNIWQKKRRTVLFVTHSVPEAVFLSDRVVVLSPRPASVSMVLSIDLPRPRAAEMKESAAFLASVSRIRGQLNGGASKDAEP